MTNTPIDLFAILRAMGKQYLGKYATKEKFAYRYCDAYVGPWGLNTSGASRLPELHSILFDTGLALRRTKKEVLKDLPEVEFRLVPIDGDRVAHEAFKKWDKELREADFSGASPVPGSDLAKARKEISIAKLGPMIDYVTYQLKSREKILQFFWHKHLLFLVVIGVHMFWSGYSS